MTSFEAKERLLSYTNAFSTPYMGGVWEAANLWNADFIAVKWDGRITEFEIKVSPADLRGEVAAIREALKPDVMEHQTHMIYGEWDRVRRDIKLSHTKIEKHHHYLVKHKKRAMSHDSASVMFYPNIFYFAVPNEMVAHAAALIKGLPYGVFDLDALKVVVKPRTIRTEPHSAGTFIHLFNRSCVMRKDLENQVIGTRLAVLEDVAAAYKLEPGSPGYRRLMKVGTAATRLREGGRGS